MPSSLDGYQTDFHGPKELVKVYLRATEDLNKAYMDGLAFCLAGTYGCGKSMATTNILKRACHKNFTSLYTTLSDVVSALTLPSSEDKFLSRKELMEVDFLVIDEFDYRHFSNTESASDLFGRTLEHILRTRLQNKLPIIMVSNSPNPLEAFQGSIKQSMESLMAKIAIIPIMGADFRKTQGK